MNKAFSVQSRKHISPLKYFKSQTTCTLPFTNLPQTNISGSNSKKIYINLSKKIAQKSQLLSLPKIARPIETEYLSEYSNASLSTQKPKISRNNSQKIVSTKQKTIFHLKQPSFELGTNQSTCKNRYTNAIQKIKNMKQINENQFQLTERSHRSSSKYSSSLLERRGYSSERQIQNFKLQLVKSNFELQKIANIDATENSQKKQAQRLRQYFNPLPSKLQ